MVFFLLLAFFSLVWTISFKHSACCATCLHFKCLNKLLVLTQCFTLALQELTKHCASSSCFSK